MTYPIPGNEIQRLKALEELSILDTAREPAFDELVSLTRDLFGVESTLITLLDEKRQWFKATAGFDLCETPRGVAFCNYTICSDEPFLVSDARLDARFQHNPLVTGEPKIRMYAGVPLTIEDGINLGTLCMIDPKPRQLTPGEVVQLRRLGNLAQSLLRQHQAAREIAKLYDQSVTQIGVISEQSASLRKQKRILDCSSDLAKLGAWEMDMATEELEFSEGLYKIHEAERTNTSIVQNHLDSYPQPDRQRLEELLTVARADNKGFTFEGRMYTTKGNLRWVRLIGDVEIKDGRVVRRFGMKQDITEQKLLSDRVERLAYSDDLTGLYNRRGLREKLAETGSAANRSQPISLFLFDLDGFKDINDSHGHGVGDACLRRIARRVKSALPRGCIVARIGGDEFGILRPGSDDARLSHDGFAQRIQEAVSRPIKWRGQTFHLSCSIGIALRQHETFNPDEIIREADLALYEAKRAGRNCYRLFQIDFSAFVSFRNQILADVRQALVEKRLALYYQPKVLLADRRITGFEALLRLNKVDGTVVAPGAFMPALEDPALSKEIGDYVISTALDQAATWKNEGVEFGSIAVNLSASQFRDPDFATSFLGAIAERGLSPYAIEVEVTENIFLSTASMNVLMACQTLKAGGVRVAFDDFGTGFASLTHLRDFPVDVLKIDRSFITDLTSGGTTAAIVNAMVTLGNNLSIGVVAEGVETNDQADFLKAIGCETAQGYLFGRPMPSSDVARFLCDVPMHSMGKLS